MKRTKNKQKPLIILTAGGTGGHVYPAEALAEELEARGYRLALITDARGKDNYKGKLGEISNIAVWSGGIVGKSKLFKLKSLFKTCIGIMQAGYVLIKDKPACVVGFGGYASFPASMAALLAGVDLVLHEQNSVMSRTNRFLSKYATLIAQSFKRFDGNAGKGEYRNRRGGKLSRTGAKRQNAAVDFGRQSGSKGFWRGCSGSGKKSGRENPQTA